MPLTSDQAKQAGAIAADIDILTAAIALVQQAIAAGMAIRSHSAIASVPGNDVSMACVFPLSAADSASVFGELQATYQRNLDALVAQLAAM